MKRVWSVFCCLAILHLHSAAQEQPAPPPAKVLESAQESLVQFREKVTAEIARTRELKTVSATEIQDLLQKLGLVRGWAEDQNTASAGFQPDPNLNTI